MIWYFTQIQLPYEFLVPYDEIYDIVQKEFMKSSKKEDVKRKKTINEQVEQKGVETVIKEQKLKQARSTPGAADQIKEPKEKKVKPEAKRRQPTQQLSKA